MIFCHGFGFLQNHLTHLIYHQCQYLGCCERLAQLHSVHLKSKCEYFTNRATITRFTCKITCNSTVHYFLFNFAVHSCEHKHKASLGGPYILATPEQCLLNAACTDLISLEEAENVLDPGVVGQALHPNQGARLRQHRRGSSCSMVGLGCDCCCHCSWWSSKVAHCGRRNWWAGERTYQLEKRERERKKKEAGETRQAQIKEMKGTNLG